MAKALELRLLSAVVLVFAWVGIAQGGDKTTFDLSKENHPLQGTFKGGEKWPGRWCDGYYNYEVNLGGVLSTVDFELNDNGTIALYADMHDLFAAAEGVYRDKKSLCVPLRGWSSIGADRAELFAEVTFLGDTGDLNDIKVKVLATKFGTLRLGKWVPGWFERFLTHLLNKTLAYVWSSSMGDWISEKISDIIKEKIPVEQRPGSTPLALAR